ncbi:MAG: LysE family transporter [Bacteriovoracaceae bacterium]|nr:LysE family transporter [Bacteriovoracaceae bacterium]
MIALILGLLIGFVMCIPVGPINVWVINTFFKHNFKSAFSIALGGSVMDFTYFMVVLTGLSLFTFTPKMSLTFKIVGVLFLFAFGLKEVLTKKQVFELDEHALKKIPAASSFFFIGVLIYTSNPTLIATMSGLAAIIKSWHVFDLNFLNYFLLSFGIAVGSAFWFYALLKIVEKYQKKIPESFLLNFSRTSGVLIILFSLFMAFNVYKEVYL